MNIRTIINDVIEKEGGFVNHPADKGGATNYGITAMSYAEYFKFHVDAVTIDMIKAIVPPVAEKIYYALYFVRPNVVSLPEIIQPIMVDMAVNHGCRGAVKILQKALVSDGYSFSPPDGIIGEKTIDAAGQAVAQLGQVFVSTLVNCRIDYYNKIIANDPSQAAFKNGWIARAESFRPAETGQHSEATA